MNSIIITRATYDAADESLRVIATSTRGVDAALEVIGLGVMKWKPSQDQWLLKLTLPITNLPSEVTVSGPEGYETQTIVIN